MITSDQLAVVARIETDMGALRRASTEERRWFETHRIAPRPISLALDPEGSAWETFWLVTDHIGANDASFRVVFDDRAQKFGRECLLNTDVPLFLGRYPSLDDVLDEIL